MSETIDGWGTLRQAGGSALLAACMLGFGMTLALAQQAQEVAKTPKPGSGVGEETAWIKVCTKDDKTGGKQVCLVKYEGVEPKTGAILIAAAVRIIEGEERQHLLINVPTAYSLTIPSGVQIKIDDGQPIPLQYAVCLPTNCQVQMDLSYDVWEQMRKGKQMFIAAVNSQQKTMAFPIPLKGFGKAFDSAPVNNAAYQEARNQMIQAARQRQIELSKKAAEERQKKQQASGQPPAAPPAAAPQ